MEFDKSKMVQFDLCNLPSVEFLRVAFGGGKIRVTEIRRESLALSGSVYTIPGEIPSKI